MSDTALQRAQRAARSYQSRPDHDLTFTKAWTERVRSEVKHSRYDYSTKLDDQELLSSKYDDSQPNVPTNMRRYARRIETITNRKFLAPGTKGTVRDGMETGRPPSPKPPLRFFQNKEQMSVPYRGKLQSQMVARNQAAGIFKGETHAYYARERASEASTRFHSFQQKATHPEYRSAVFPTLTQRPQAPVSPKVPQPHVGERDAARQKADRIARNEWKVEGGRPSNPTPVRDAFWSRFPMNATRSQLGKAYPGIYTPGNVMNAGARGLAPAAGKPSKPKRNDILQLAHVSGRMGEWWAGRDATSRSRLQRPVYPAGKMWSQATSLENKGPLRKSDVSWWKEQLLLAGHHL